MMDVTRCTIIPGKDTYDLGVSKNGNEYSFAVTTDSDSLRLLLFSEPGTEPDYIYTLHNEYKEGSVFSFSLKNVNLENVFYLYEDDNGIFTDPYARIIYKSEDYKNTVYGVIHQSQFDWTGDNKPQIPKNDMIMYKLHVRGFTANPNSRVKYGGTFKALGSKIPYLNQLGINVVELMPVYETNNSPDERKNYWGYGKGLYFAANTSYSSCYGSVIDYTRELKNTIKQFHNNGIEVVLEMFFDSEASVALIMDCIRYWKREYHIDGVHLICDDRVRYAVSQDPFISEMKLFFTDWYGYKRKNLYEYNDGFEYVARRLLKGDEEQLQAFIYAMRKNPNNMGNVNYICNNNGFTLMDLVSYDRKHNELNGESNRDGIDYNFSWNCGIEGATRKKKITELRTNQMKNAMMLLLLSQGIPLIYAGDEFGNSQNGNNNAYCQDNEIGWVDWSALKRNKVLNNFVKDIIAFRKQHKVLHMSAETYMTDYKYLGYPDLSIHSSRAFYPELEHYNRHFGVMLCGLYAGEEDNIYIGINMHWEAHELALPLISGKHWKIILSSKEENILELCQSDKSVLIEPRSIIVLMDEKNS